MINSVSAVPFQTRHKMLTIDEHIELGNELKKTTARMRQLCGLVVSVYGPQSLPGFGFMRTMETLDRLRAEMEAQAARDLQGYASKNLYL
jgi:hypothetical protein